MNEWQDKRETQHVVRSLCLQTPHSLQISARVVRCRDIVPPHSVIRRSPEHGDRRVLIDRSVHSRLRAHPSPMSYRPRLVQWGSPSLYRHLISVSVTAHPPPCGFRQESHKPTPSVLLSSPSPSHAILATRASPPVSSCAVLITRVLSGFEPARTRPTKLTVQTSWSPVG